MMNKEELQIKINKAIIKGGTGVYMDAYEKNELLMNMFNYIKLVELNQNGGKK